MATESFTRNLDIELDYAYKGDIWGVVKTDAGPDTIKITPANEHNYIIPAIRADCIWLDSDTLYNNPIFYNKPSVAKNANLCKSKIVQAFDINLTQSQYNPSLAGRSWNTDTIRWIGGEYGGNYIVKVAYGEHNIDISSLTEFDITFTSLDVSDPNYPYVFNYGTGILTFVNNIPPGLTNNVIYVIGYIYTGRLGLTSLISGGSNITCGTINTQGSNINVGTGTINSGAITSTSIYTQNSSINLGTGTIYGTIIATSITSGQITTQNNSINIGSGIIYGTFSSITTASINTQNNSINIGSAMLYVGGVFLTSYGNIFDSYGNIYPNNIYTSNNNLLLNSNGNIYPTTVASSNYYNLNNLYNIDSYGNIIGNSYSINNTLTVINSNANMTIQTITTQNNTINTGSGKIYTSSIYLSNIYDTFGNQFTLPVKEASYITSSTITTQNNTINIGSGILYGNLIANTILSGPITSSSITTKNNNINIGSGKLYTCNIIVDTITSGSITTQNNNINIGSGKLYTGDLIVDSVTSGIITTQNNNINIGSGNLIVNQITSGSIITQNNTINIGSGTIYSSNIYSRNINSTVINNTLLTNTFIQTSNISFVGTIINNSTAIPTAVLLTSDAAGAWGYVRLYDNLYTAGQQTNGVKLNGLNYIASGQRGISDLQRDLQANIYADAIYTYNQYLLNGTTVDLPNTFGQLVVLQTTQLYSTTTATITTQNNDINVGTGNIIIGTLQFYTSGLAQPTPILNINSTSISALSGITPSAISVTQNDVYINYPLHIGNNLLSSSNIITDSFTVNNTATINTLNVANLNLTKQSLPSLTVTNTLVASSVTTGTITTQNYTINAGSGTIYGNIRSISSLNVPTITASTISIQNGTINNSNGTLITKFFTTNFITTGYITTQNNSINVGTGTVVAGSITTQKIFTQNNSINVGSGGIIAQLYSAFCTVTPTITALSTIAPIYSQNFVSGTSQISNITPPSPISTYGGQITLIPTSTWTTSSNSTTYGIALSTTAVISKALIMTYNPGNSLWYPSY